MRTAGRRAEDGGSAQKAEFEMSNEKVWILRDEGNPEADAAISELAEETGLLPVTARLLYYRGCRTAEAVRVFLTPTGDRSLLHDPFLLCDMPLAVARIRRALAEHTRIVIYGDYDVDGVTSVTLLYRYLRSKGAEVGYYIPSRAKEGYGVSVPAVEQLAAEGYGLMITVDTGITAVEEVARATELGMEVVVTDHHECQSELPRASAVVNPCRPDCEYPFKELAGVGVVFKLVSAIEISEGEEQGIDRKISAGRVFDEYVDLVALGTVADVMSLLDENRLIVAGGIAKMQKSTLPGLEALIEVSSARSDTGAPAKKRKINSGYIGFGLAPRINAAGRIDHATKAVRLLLAEDRKEALSLAEELCEINRRRQVEENRIAEQAYRQIEAMDHPEDTRVLVLADDAWTQGVIGIVASRLTDRFGLPSILISFDGATRGYPAPDDVGKGSGRSVHGINLVDALQDSSDLLERFGGHELAAGLSVKRCNIEAFRERINEYAEKQLGGGKPVVTLDADCELAPEEITMELAAELDRLEPFGTGNPVPVFFLRDVAVQRVIPLGGGKHTKLIVGAGGYFFTALWFGRSPESLGFEAGERADLYFQLSINEYQGVRSLQLLIQDASYPKTYDRDFAKEKQRYEEIRNGGSFDESEGIIPDRPDFVTVYTLLRRDFRAGQRVFRQRALLHEIRNAGTSMSYARLKYTLRIMNELNICRITETAEDEYFVDIYFTQNKAVIERSSILRTLRSRCGHDAD